MNSTPIVYKVALFLALFAWVCLSWHLKGIPLGFGTGRCIVLHVITKDVPLATLYVYGKGRHVPKYQI